MDRISRDDVVDCYLRLLGRPPESEDVVSIHLGAASSYRQLVDIFVRSEEFRERRGQPAAGGGPVARDFIPIGRAHNRIQTSLRDAELQQCLSSVKTAWTRLGEERAHHSVLTNENFLPDRLGENLDSFWQSGEHEAEDTLRVVERYLRGPAARAVLNELGSGVGRVTVPFSRSFEFVNGYDISAAHLAFARARARDVDARNIAFREVAAGTLPHFEPCDVFYTRIVLQHNPPPLIMHLIARMLASLRPGGLAIFQVPTYMAGYSFVFSTWLASFTGRGMEMHVVPMDEVFQQIAEHRCAAREVREDGATGDARIISTTFVAQKL